MGHFASVWLLLGKSLRKAWFAVNRNIKHLLRYIGLVILGCFIVVNLANQAVAAATPWIGDTHASARLISATEATGNAPQIDVGLQLKLEPLWHAYWRSPGDAGIPPSIDWSGSTNIKKVDFYWPPPKRFLLFGLVTQGYEDGVIFPISVAVQTPGMPAHLNAIVHYSACKDICIPYTAKFDLLIPAGIAMPGPEAGLIADAWTKIPGDLSAVGLSLSHVLVSNSQSTLHNSELSVKIAAADARFVKPDIFVEGLPGATPSSPSIKIDLSGRHATFDIAVPDGSVAALTGKPLRFTLENNGQSASFTASPEPGAEAGSFSVFGIIAIAVLGGLILNVMPCVLPVLSMKLLSFVSASGTTRRQLRFNLLSTACGILISFGVIAGVLIGLKSIGASIGWGIQFQYPWFLGFMALVTTLFAATLWQWLPIPLPGVIGRAGTIGQTSHSAYGAFLTGCFATLLAVSCTAPFVGTAVGFALAGNAATIVGIFLALGVGMALPYLAVAAAPGLVHWLPRPGAWMLKVQILLGFALFGTSLWLLWIISLAVSLSTALITGAILLIILGVLASRHRYHVRRSITGMIVGILAVLVIAVPILATPTLMSTPSQAMADQTRWQNFDGTKIPGLIVNHKIIFVDVTAAWCLICKVNDLTVLEQQPVTGKLHHANVVAMRADWTRPSTTITAYLQSFGRYGVPLDVIYGPEAPQGIVLPSLLTPGVVMQAFAKAAGSATPSINTKVEK